MTGSHPAVARVAARYRDTGRFARHYVAAKLRTDPVHADLLALAAAEGGFGAVVDAGCGRGQLGLLLLEAGVAASVLGLDRNAAHLAAGTRASGTLAWRGQHQDFGHAAALPAADTVLLIDVLYQLDTAAQIALLHGAAHAARARVIVRTADPDLGFRARLSEALERAGRRVWPHSGARVNARPIAALAAPLQQAGFRVAITPCSRGTPFANVMLVARRA